MDVINNITEFFTGNSSAPANPDPAFNAMLLKEAKKKVEIGIFTRFFKKPVLILMEILSYGFALLLLFVGIYFYGQVDNLLSAIQTLGQGSEVISNLNWDSNNIRIIEALLLVLSISPALISFLIGRLFTKARKRINTMIEVENMIDRVIYNLSGEQQ